MLSPYDQEFRPLIADPEQCALGRSGMPLPHSSIHSSCKSSRPQALQLAKPSGRLHGSRLQSQSSMFDTEVSPYIQDAKP